MCVLWMSLEEVVINVLSYLCSCRKAKVITILSAKTVCDGTAEVPRGTGVSCPFGGGGKLQLRGCWNRHWVGHDSQSRRAKFLLVINWIESVISITLGTGYRGLDGWEHSIKVVVLHHKAPSLIYSSDLGTDKIGLSNREAGGIIIPLFTGFYTISFHLWRS